MTQDNIRSYRNMKWLKKGLIYTVNNQSRWAHSHAHKPTPLLIDDKTLRIYFGIRDIQNRTRTTFIDVNPKDPKRIKYIHDRPCLDLGKIGAFDDSGVNVSAVVQHGERIYMYYIGWNPGTTVHTRNSIGIAVSHDKGKNFERLYDGPILDRNKDEPYYTGAVFVHYSQTHGWKMWYTSGTRWEIINDRPEISYHIKYAESDNGIDWERNNISCILPQHQFEATARPCVIIEDGIYKMWYSRRDIRNFRTNKEMGYRAGYAESYEGKTWKRLDEYVGIEPSERGWDSEAIAYPFVYIYQGQKYLLYNGNGFGKSGFGYAVDNSSG